MEHFLKELSTTITTIIGWIYTTWEQIKNYIITTNTKVDLAIESYQKMINVPWFITLLVLPVTAMLVRNIIKIIFKR